MFREDIEKYFDQDGLIGNKPNPEIWSGGNEILDTAIWVLYLKKRGELLVEDKIRFSVAIRRCERIKGILDKNPGRPDQITRDDLLSAAIADYICGGGFNLSLYNYAINHHWILSNTGKFYWSALTKPWDRELIRLLSWAYTETFWLTLSIMHDAIFNKSNHSDKKLMWVIIQGLKHRQVSGVLLKAIKYWEARFSLKETMIGYYGKEHPYSIYA